MGLPGVITSGTGPTLQESPEHGIGPRKKHTLGKGFGFLGIAPEKEPVKV